MRNKHKIIILYTLFLFVASFIGSKVLTVEIGTVLSPIRIGLLLSPLFLRQAKVDNVTKIGKTKVFIFLFVWTIYSLLQIVLINDFGEYFRHLFFLVSAFIISYFASIYLNDENDFRLILQWFEIIAVIFSLIGIYEIITGDYRFINENSIDRYRDNSAVFSTIGIRVPTGSFANPNDFGFFLLFAFCISEALTQLRDSRIGKTFSRICTILFCFMVVATQSRAAFISLLLGIFVLFVLNYHKMKPSTKVLLFLFFIVFASYALSWLLANKDLYETLLEIDVSGSDGSDRTRLNLLENGLSILINYAFMGAGLGQIEGNMVGHGLANTEGITNIHNWWAEVLVSSGVIIFIYYVKMYINSSIFFFRKSFSGNISNTGAIYARLGASLVTVFFIGCMSSSSIFCIEWIWAMFIYWMLLYRVIE